MYSFAGGLGSDGTGDAVEEEEEEEADDDTVLETIALACACGP